jgi:hypothetical protein
MDCRRGQGRWCNGSRFFLKTKLQWTDLLVIIPPPTPLGQYRTTGVYEALIACAARCADARLAVALLFDMIEHAEAQERAMAVRAPLGPMAVRPGDVVHRPTADAYRSAIHACIAACDLGGARALLGDMAALDLPRTKMPVAEVAAAMARLGFPDDAAALLTGATAAVDAADRSSTHASAGDGMPASSSSSKKLSIAERMAAARGSPVAVGKLARQNAAVGRKIGGAAAGDSSSFLTGETSTLLSRARTGSGATTVSRLDLSARLGPRAAAAIARALAAQGREREALEWFRAAVRYGGRGSSSSFSSSSLSSSSSSSSSTTRGPGPGVASDPDFFLSTATVVISALCDARIAALSADNHAHESGRGFDIGNIGSGGSGGSGSDFTASLVADARDVVAWIVRELGEATPLAAVRPIVAACLASGDVDTARDTIAAAERSGLRIPGSVLTFPIQAGDVITASPTRK